MTAPGGSAQVAVERFQVELDAVIENLRRLRGEMAAPPGGGALIRGYVAVRVGGANQGGDFPGGKPQRTDIYLPDVLVTLRNPETGDVTDPVRTDLSGRFTTRAALKARYEICYEAKGFDPGCTGTFVSADRRYRSIGTVAIPLPQGRGFVAVFGDVKLADGSVPRALEPTFNVNAFATISLLDARGNLRHAAAVNNDGLYVLPQVPLMRRLLLRVREEGYTHDQPMQLGNAGFPVQRIDLVMLNAPPRIQPLAAQDDRGERVGNARGGSTVALLARVDDPDGDGLEFRWQVTGGTLSDPTALEPKWTLPSRPGNHAATLLAFDGRGGYAQSSVNVSTRRGGVIFSGFVRGSDQPALPGAQVDINGRIAVTDGSGFFRVAVPDRRRFVVNIRRQGYALASNTYGAGVVGGSWTLTRAEVLQVDPAQPIDVQNRPPG
jgi:hypothetical protein